MISYNQMIPDSTKNKQMYYYHYYYYYYNHKQFLLTVLACLFMQYLNTYWSPVAAQPPPMLLEPEITTTLAIPIELQVNQSTSNGKASTVTPQQVAELTNELLFNRRNPLTSSIFNNVTIEMNDFNKELVDYGPDFLESLYFIETERAALNEQAAKVAVNAILAKHHNNEETHQYLLELAQKYPEICRLYSIGESTQKRKLWALEITEEPGKAANDKPEFRLIGNMHGNEVVGRELILHFARLLAENYRASKLEPYLSDTKPSGPKFVEKLLKKTRIHLLPTMNPDGYANSRESCKYEGHSRRGRINDKNIDLNRNFPDRILGNKEDAGTQPEVKAVIQWSKSIPFVLSASLHGGSLVVSYGYDGNNRGDLKPEYTACPDDDIISFMSLIYAQHHPFMGRDELSYDECTDYHPETFPNGTTNGAAWYPLYGSSGDWLYENTNGMELTIEVGSNQYPPAQSLPSYWAFNKLSLLMLVQQVHRGFRGVVRDFRSKEPLSNVTVRVLGRGHDIRTGQLGEYFKLLTQGNYDVSFEKPGYRSKKVFVNVVGSWASVYDVELESIETPTTTLTPGSNSTTLEGQQTIPEPQIGLKPNEDEHSLAVATLVMTVIITLILLAMVGAYVIQKRRFTRSQSMSMELQPASRSTASTGVSLGVPIGQQQQKLNLPQAGGSSTNTHLSA